MIPIDPWPQPDDATELDSRTVDGARAPAPGLPAGTIILDDWEVVRPLGRGGMGAVYLVRSRLTGVELALKRVRPELAGSSQHRRAFLRELLIWSELPEHENLASFRFFRSSGEEVLIFSEPVSGGSLSEWITDGRAGRTATALDLAIQVGRGLRVAHDRGVGHLDVKPGNVLMTGDGVAKLTDFGLARAHRFSSESAEGGGYTPAFCSPEQAAGSPSIPGSDIWSWGLMLLAMLIGGVRWGSGQAAREVLQGLQEGDEEDRPDLPPAVGAVLARCFAPAPAERWSDMGAATSALEAAYQELTGEPYPRRAPPETPPPTEPAPLPLRQTAEGSGWPEPRIWLERALVLAGRDPVEAEELVLPPGRTSRSLALADMVGYAEAQAVMEGLLAEGRLEIRGQYASLCVDRSKVHDVAGDGPGELHLLDRAREVLRELVREGRTDQEDLLATIQARWSYCAWKLGLREQGLAALEQARATWERLMERDGLLAHGSSVGKALSNLGSMMRALNRNRESRIRNDRAVTIGQEMTRLQPEGGHELELARLYLNRAATLIALADDPAALEDLVRAEEIYQRLVLDGERWELMPQLAQVIMNQASVQSRQDRAGQALLLQGRVVTLLREVVEARGRVEHGRLLGQAWINLSALHENLGQRSEALEAVEASVQIFHRLALREGQTDLVGHLAHARLRRVSLLRDLDREGDQRATTRESLAVLRREASRTGEPMLFQVLEWAEDALADLL